MAAYYFFPKEIGLTTRKALRLRRYRLTNEAGNRIQQEHHERRIKQEPLSSLRRLQVSEVAGIEMEINGRLVFVTIADKIPIS